MIPPWARSGLKLTLMPDSKGVTMMTIERLLEALNAIEAAIPATAPRLWHAKIRRRWIAIDHGTSGMFLVEKATGEIYNIKAYGVPDHNKKIKSNLGNLATVDPAYLHAHRFNYLR